MITQITDDMVGKKITCKIYSTVISDAKIRKYEDKYYICNNSRSGSTPNDGDKLGYNYSWSIKTGSESDIANHSVSELRLLKTELPIFN